MRTSQILASLLGGLGLGVVAGAMSGGSSSSSGGSGGSSPGGDAADQKGLADVRKLAAAAGLPKAYQDFLVFCAFGESRGNNMVGLGIPDRYPPWTKTHATWVANGMPAPGKLQVAEAKAAAKGYSNNHKWLGDCWPEFFYAFGSGGWFGLLPSSGLAVFRGTALACQHPWSIFDGPTSIVMAMGFARRLRGWSAFKANPTMLALRVGWGAPSKMNDKTWLDERRVRYTAHAKSVGLPVSFLDQKPPPLPSFDPVALMSKLGGQIWLPSPGVA